MAKKEGNGARPGSAPAKEAGGAARPERVLSFTAAAERLGMSEKSLTRLINRGEAPPFVQLGRSRVFREVTLENWLVMRERASLDILRANQGLVNKFAR